jgi:hypothetical protein
VPNIRSWLVKRHFGLVDEAVAAWRSDEPDRRWSDPRCLVFVGWSGWPLVERAMGAVDVVMLDVFDDEPFELAGVPDDGPVEQFTSQGPDPSFSEGAKLPVWQ